VLAVVSREVNRVLFLEPSFPKGGSGVIIER
jgi:hypothetical protein